MSSGEKQYGLIEPKTGKKLTISDVFNNDSDSGEEKEGSWMKKSNQPKEEKGLRKQTKLEMQRALDQDPTVYQYDEIYDDMSQKKQELEQLKVSPEKKPKYIHNLLKTAEKRKKENERRLERQIQKEREAEGDNDREEFITSSYKQKLEEFKKAEEEEKKMEYIESVMDVSKQQDLGGFYRHLYKETVEGKSLVNKGEGEGSESPSFISKKSDSQTQESVKQQERNYRKRNSSDSMDGEEKKEKQCSSSSSSDSDSSSDSSSTTSSSEDEKPEEKSAEVKLPVEKALPENDVITTTEKHEKNEEKEISVTKNLKYVKEESKGDAREEKSRNGSKPSSKSDDRDRRDRYYRPSGSDRDRGSRIQSRRDGRSYNDRDRDRDRDRRDDYKTRDRRDDRRNSSSRRRRSKTPESRRGRNRSRERSFERSRSRRGQDRGKDNRESRSNIEDERKKEVKEGKKEEPKEVEEKKQVEVELKVSIWEKRTIGAVFEAAVERYKQRKAARGS